MQSPKTTYLLPIISHDFKTAKKFIENLFETQFVIDILMKYQGNISFAAKNGGLTIAELEELIAKHNINVESFKR